ncbi:MAG: hypothetical protein ACLUEQ_11960 [Cloacibacillus evryensis]
MRRSPKGLPWQRVVMADGSIAGGVDPGPAGRYWRRGVAFLPDGHSICGPAAGTAEAPASD